MIRVYFNSHKDAPQVWSVDEGSHATEINVQDIRVIDVTGHTRYNPNAEWPEPKAWLQYEAAYYVVSGGIVTIRPY